MIISLNICVSDIPRDKIRTSDKNGKKYLNLTLMDNRGGPDKYDQDGFCSIATTKDERASGEKGKIIGNWKYLVAPGEQKAVSHAGKGASGPFPKPAATSSEEQDEIPF